MRCAALDTGARAVARPLALWAPHGTTAVQSRLVAGSISAKAVERAPDHEPAGPGHVALHIRNTKGAASVALFLLRGQTHAAVDHHVRHAHGAGTWPEPHGGLAATHVIVVQPIVLLKLIIVVIIFILEVVGLVGLKTGGDAADAACEGHEASTRASHVTRDEQMIAAVHNDVAGAPQVHVEVCSSTIDEDIACAAGGPEGQVLQVAEHGGEAVPKGRNVDAVVLAVSLEVVHNQCTERARVGDVEIFLGAEAENDHGADDARVVHALQAVSRCIDNHFDGCRGAEARIDKVNMQGAVDDLCLEAFNDAWLGLDPHRVGA
mmetsp:Transcript_41710/g.105630  ORF Transcript_41710/g.105630 Transcript_41710/m.105630 type:complete len:320 (+) Transcript_41710:584-1543(+)